jgi:phosphohistidine phosphatase
MPFAAVVSVVRCYFLRHGIAVEAESWSGNDFDRPLTGEGRARLEQIAKAIANLSLGLEWILSSPLLRAKQTAEIVAARLNMRGYLVEEPRLAGGFDLERLSAILRTHAAAKAIMLVGHEPSMSATIGHAIGAARVELKKAALAAVEFFDPNEPSGTLLSLVPPKILAALGRR